MNEIDEAAARQELIKLLDEMRAAAKPYDHDARPDDDNGPGDRCKDCGDDITWVGPSHVDWLHVAEQDWWS